MNEMVAAFFDLDGTLIPEPSLETRFFSTLREQGAIPTSNYLYWLVEALCLLPDGLLAVQHANKRYLTGLNSDLALEHVDSVTFFEEGIERVAWHARQFHPIVLVTGTLHPLAQLAAAALECELEARGLAIHVHILATRIKESRGYWTGSLAGEALYGAGKARAVVALAKERDWNLSQCHGYGNAVLDRDFLCAVGHGHAVNPGRDLAAVANEKDWPIWHWHQEKKLVPRTSSKCVSEIHSLEGQA
jgi:phosphoserine phosphatase